MTTPTIISPDTRRGVRLPPGQAESAVAFHGHWGEVPRFDPAKWSLTIFGPPMVDAVKSFDWTQFQALPRVQVYADYHCVSGRSRLNNLWMGVSTAELRVRIAIASAAKFLMIHSEYGHCSNLPIDDFFGDDVLLAIEHNGAAISPELGGPVRLIVPRLYAYKSVKWVRGIEFLSEDRAGFYESPEHGGHHHRGDPWREERIPFPTEQTDGST